jgi:2-dehydropantoate 2-reductase
MRICIFGAGAVGGHMAAKLARAGADVCVVARGPHLEAIRANGLRLITPSEEFAVRLRASADARDLGRQDVVISTLKANSLPGAVDAMLPLLGPDTPVVFAVNGIPWWYFHGMPADGDRTLPRLERLDPEGSLRHRLGVARAVGCVISSPNEVVEPGVVHNKHDNNRFMLGEPDGSISPRLASIEKALRPGLPGVALTQRIREEIWSKLMLNLTTSPLACLTDHAAAGFMQSPDLRILFHHLVAEGRAVAQAWGIPLALDADELAERLSSSQHIPSMLKDLRAGRPIEIDAQLAAPRDLGRHAGVATPWLDVMVALLEQRARPQA